MNKKKKQPWPTKAVMDQIYDRHLWGGKAFDFYSGAGSHDTEIIIPFFEAVSEFFKSFKKSPIVCDLGCGDFNIGKQLIPYTKKYIAVDIVEDLITRNARLYSADNLEFHCLDIAKDKLPQGDCAILRQVLQHLSNAEIVSIVHKLKNYKYVILTEHIPVGEFKPNKDIISGQGNRLKYNSGVNLLEPPFNLETKEVQHLTTYTTEDLRSQITTSLYCLF